MDLWIVAAATGAGYVAKYWKNQSENGDSLSQVSFGESNLASSQCSNHLLNKFSPRKIPFEDVFGHATFSDQNPFDIDSVAALVSLNVIGNEKLGLFGSHQDLNVTLKSWVDENSKGHIGESSKSNKMANEIGILACNSSGRIGSWRNRSTAKARFSDGNLIKPLNFVEDCLVAHESSVSPCIGLELEENKLLKVSNFDATESVCGLSQLPLGSSNMSDIVSNKKGKGWEIKSRSSRKMTNRKNFASKGAPEEMFILYLGFFIGMIYSFISNKRKVHKLKDLLKQTEYLVEDLQEELEMKDSLKLKELSNDNCESYTCSNAFSEKTGDGSSSKHVMNYTVNFSTAELYEQKAEEGSESMSRIEAELEAELERLGLDINTEGTERFLDEEEEEIDPEFKEDFAEGELRIDMISRQSSGWTKPNEEASNSTAHSGNYTVSPRELSLRLHDVIQSRLEERIKELENALQNNHRKLKLVDTENRSSWLELASGELQFTSNESSPNTKDESKIATQPGI